jgi:hypothetical protein
VDLGPWEKVPQHGRASGIGICLAAFKEAQKYFTDRQWDSEKTCTVDPQVDLKKILAEGIKSGERSLEHRIPQDGSQAIETKEMPIDAALSLLLLFNPGLNNNQEAAILNAMEPLIGSYGIRRMPNRVDLFMGQNHNTNHKEGSIWGVDGPSHEAAQWTMFDPILANYHYQRYLASEGDISC